MNIDLALLGQMINFVLLVVFTMKFIWPPIMRAVAERQKTIADGLAAGERGRLELERAQKKAANQIKQAHADVAEVLRQANRQAAALIENAKAQARAEGERLIAAAKAQIEHETARAREQLRAELASLAVAGAARILKCEIDTKAHKKLLDEFVAGLE